MKHNNIHLLLILIPLTVAIVLLYQFSSYIRIQPNSTIEFSDLKSIFDSKRELYISKKDIDKIDINTTDANATLQGSPIDIIWNPKKLPPRNSDISAQFDIESNTEIQYELTCSSCSDKKTLDKGILFSPTLQSHRSVYNTDGIHVLLPHTISPNSTSAQTTSAQEYILEHISSTFPLHIQNYDNVELSQLENKSITSTTTGTQHLTSPIVGTTEILIFIPHNQLDVSISKQDLNKSAGSDTATAELYDLDGSLLIHKNLTDDGQSESTNTRGTEKTYNLSKQLPSSGVYRLRISQGSDSIITGLSGSISHLLFIDTLSIIEPQSVWIESESPIEIEIYSTESSLGGKNMLIDSFGNKKVLNIVESDIYSWKTYQMNAGRYSISLLPHQKIRGTNFAMIESDLFSPFIYDISAAKRNSVVLSKIGYHGSQGNRSTISYSLLPDSKSYIYDGETIKLRLKNEQLEKQYTFLETANERQLSTYSTGQEYLYTIENTYDYLTINSLIKNIPNGETILFNNSEAFQQIEYLSNTAPDTYSSKQKEIISVPLKGNHRAYVYGKKTITLSVQKSDLNLTNGSDQLDINIIDPISESILCTTTITDDGNTTNDKKVLSTQQNTLQCKLPKSGIYIVDLTSDTSNGDFHITSMRINSNAVVFESLLAAEPTTVYSGQSGILGGYFWRSGNQQSISIANDVVTDEFSLKKQDRYIRKEHTLLQPDEKTVSSISIPKGNVLLDGILLTTKANLWFDPFSLYIAEYSSPVMNYNVYTSALEDITLYSIKINY